MIQSANGTTEWNPDLAATFQTGQSLADCPTLEDSLSDRSQAILRRSVDVLSNRNSTQQAVANTLQDLACLCQQVRDALDRGDWQAFRKWLRHHPIYELLIQDPISQNPLEMEGNGKTPARLLDHMFSTEHGWAMTDMNWIGRRINSWSIHQGLCCEARDRRDFFAQTIDQVAGEKSGAHVMAYSAGHLREAELATSIIRRKLGRLLAVDTNSDHLALIQRDYGNLGLSIACQSDVEWIAKAKDFGSFDLIYSPSLCDDTPDQIATDLVSTLFRQLKPRGKLLLTGYTKLDRWMGYREAVMNWDIHYRNRFEMLAITEGINDRELQSIRWHSSPSELTHYLLLERAE